MSVVVSDTSPLHYLILCGAQSVLAVIGTIGLLEQASARGLLDLPQMMERLRQTNARLSPDLFTPPLNGTERGNRRGKAEAALAGSRSASIWPACAEPS